MPNRSGSWGTSAQMQAIGNQKWTQAPAAPTIGTATAGSSLCASVTFTAPSFLGNPPASGCSAYQVVSSPGCITVSGSGSPITVTGLTDATSYTFTVKSQNTIDFGASSAASNSIAAVNAGQQTYASPGSYCWTAPSGVTKVSVLSVGAGGGVYQTPGSSNTRWPGAGGGGLGYKNNITVTPGTSYPVVVGARGPGGTGSCCQNGGDSYFVNATGNYGKGCGGFGADNNQGSGNGRGGGTFFGDGGGAGGNGGDAGSGGGGGGGGGGYSGTGGHGAAGSGNGSDGNGGGGGGGGSSGGGGTSGGAGGGVGLLGEGSSGAGGASVSGQQPFRGGGGSGGGGGGQQNSCGGSYGGGGGWTYYSSSAGRGGFGAVRIIWPGDTRSFPSTCTGNL